MNFPSCMRERILSVFRQATPAGGLWCPKGLLAGYQSSARIEPVPRSICSNRDSTAGSCRRETKILSTTRCAQPPDCAKGSTMPCVSTLEKAWQSIRLRTAQGNSLPLWIVRFAKQMLREPFSHRVTAVSPF